MEDVTAVAARVDALQQLTQQPAAGFAALLAKQTAQAAPTTSGASAPAAPAPAADSTSPAPAAAAAANVATPGDAVVPIPTAGPSGPTATLGQMLAGPVPNLPWSQVATAAPPLAVSATADAAPAAPAAPAQVGPGGMVTPVEGRFSSPFGMRTHPITGAQKMHKGIDIAAPEGTPIKSAAAGTVSYSGVMGGYGNVMIVDHGNGTETRYAHNSSNGVKVGEKVSAGQVIGRVGSTGMSTGPHLHFEVRRNGEAVDPTKFIKL